MKLLSTLVLTLIFASHAFAHSAGDIIVRGGVAHASPNDDSDPVVVDTTTLQGVTVGSDTQLGLTISYMFTDNVGIELLASTPFEHDIDIKGAPVKAGTTKHLPPTLSVQYYFGDSTSAFRPYVGGGVNATFFFDETADPQLETAVEGIVGAPAGTVDLTLDLDTSWGVAAQAGFDYQLSDKLYLNGAVWYIDMATDATVTEINTNDGTAFGVDIDPWVVMFGIGYKF